VRLPINSWTNTLTKLGFRKVKRRAKVNRTRKEQRLSIESLEPRQLLTVDPSGWGFTGDVSVAEKAELHEYARELLTSYSTEGLEGVTEDFLQGTPSRTPQEYSEFIDTLMESYSDDQWQDFADSYANGEYSPFDDIIVYAMSTVSDQSEHLDYVSDDAFSAYEMWTLRSLMTNTPTVEQPGSGEESSGSGPNPGALLPPAAMQSAGLAVYDVDGDGVMDIDDYTEIETAVRTSATYDAKHDVDEDSDVDEDDLMQWFDRWEEVYTVIPGDTDLDADVDVSEQLIVFNNFTGPGSFGSLRTEGDVHRSATPTHLVGDGDIDVTDILATFENFTGPVNATQEISTTSVTLPSEKHNEPASIGLLQYTSGEPIGATLTYQLTNDNTTFITASITGDTLNLTYNQPTVFDESNLVITAEDQWGNTVDIPLTVGIYTADVEVISLVSDSSDEDLIVTYDISDGDATAFNIGLYTSQDGVTPDTLLQTVAATNLLEGTGYTQTIVPDFTQADVTTDPEEDYYLIAMVDRTDVLFEEFEDNNVVEYAGGIFVDTTDDVIHVHGTDEGAGPNDMGMDDEVHVQTSGSNIRITMNGASPVDFASADFDEVHVRGHENQDMLETGDDLTNTPMWFFGGQGHDRLIGNKGPDRLYGGPGNDWIDGHEGDDLIYGGDGHDNINGQQGDDQIWGEDGDDVLIGAQANDKLYGGDGSDDLRGGISGDDELYGGNGRDTLNGGDGDDLIDGGADFDDVEILDDGQTGTTASVPAAWQSATSGFNDDQLESTGSTPSTYEWKFTDLSPGRYEILVTWNGSGFYDSAEFTIDHQGGSTTIDVDQSQAVAGETIQDTTWLLLDSNYFADDGELTVTLDFDGTNDVAADAVHIRRPDNTLSVRSSIFQGEDLELRATFNSPAIDGDVSEVYFYLDANGDGLAQVSEEIGVDDTGVDTGGDSTPEYWTYTVSTEYYDYQDYTFIAVPLVTQQGLGPSSMEDPEDSEAAANAETKVEPFESIIDAGSSSDNAVGDTGYQEFGDDATRKWRKGNYQPGQAYGGDYRRFYLEDNDSGIHTATWSWSNLKPGTYTAYANWITGTNHAMAVPYKIYGSLPSSEGSFSSSALATTEKNHRVAPSGFSKVKPAESGTSDPTTYNWEEIGTVTIGDAGELSVEIGMDGISDCWVIADAMMLREVVGGGASENHDDTHDSRCQVGCVEHQTGENNKDGYYSAANPHPFISHSYTLNPYKPVPDKVEAKVTIGGVDSDTVYYDTSTLTAGDQMQISIQIDTGLTTGRYDYTMTITEHHGEETSSVEIDGTRELFDHGSSEFGNRRWRSDLDRLYFDTDGVSVFRGNTTAGWFESDGQGGYITPEGSFTTLVKNLDDTYTLTDRYNSKTEFDANGFLTARTDALGNSTTYSYKDGDGDLVADELDTVTDPFGRTTVYAYTNGLVSSVTDYAGRVTTYAYDVNGRLETVTEPNPDGAGTKYVSPVTTYTYTTEGLLATTTDALQNVTTSNYESNHLFSDAEHADGSTWSMTPFYTHGYVDLSTGIGTETNPAPATLTSNADGRHVDERGNETILMADRYGLTTARMDALGNLYQWRRNDDGMVTRAIEPDPDGESGPLEELITDYEYDDDGNVTKATYADGSSESWTYDPVFGMVTSHTDEIGRVTLYEIDQTNGLLLSETTVFGEEVDTDQGSTETDDVTWSYTYTDGTGTTQDLPKGLILTETDPEGRVTDYEYYTDDTDPTYGHAFGWVKSITFAKNTTDEADVQYEYDAAGNVTKVTDELGHVTDYEYDALDRLTTITEEATNDHTAPVTTFEYDAEDNLRFVIDAEGNTTEYVYDERYRLVQVIEEDPTTQGGDDNPTTTYAYDGANNLTSVTDPLGRTTTYVYDELNRLVRTEYAYPSEFEVATADDADGSPDYVETGTWSAGPTTGYRGTTSQAATGASNSATWTFDGLDVNEEYEVFVTWSADAGNTTDADYTIEHGIVTETAVTVDQTTDLSSAATGHLQDGVYWYSLGAITVTAASLTVTLDGGTTGNLNADAVFLQATAPIDEILVDDADGSPDYVETGTWSVGPTTGYQGASKKVATTAGATATWAIDGLLVDQQYEIFVTWVAEETNTEDAEYTITHGLVSEPVVELNQKLDLALDSDAVLLDGTYWMSLGVVTATDSSIEVELAGGTTGYLNADAVFLREAAPVEIITYDNVGNVASTSDQLGNTTHYTYDERHRLLTMTEEDPDTQGGTNNPVWTYGYDLAGQLTSVTDPLDRVTSYEYDNLGRLTKLTEPDVDDSPLSIDDIPVTVYEYDKASNLTSVTDAEDNETTYVYDKRNRMTQTIAPAPGDSSHAAPEFDYEYDDAGRLTKTIDPLNRETVYDYDELNRLIKVTYPDVDGDSQTTTDIPEMVYHYDKVGNETSMVDAEGNETTYEYDNLYRLISVTGEDPTTQGGSGGPVTEYTYDIASQLLEIEDPLDRVTVYEYDRLGRLVRETYPDPDGAGAEESPVMSYVYDAASNQLLVIDALNNVTAYEYDNLYRLTKVVEADPDGSGSPLLSPETTYAYDLASQLTSVTDPLNRVTSYEYDQLGRVEQVTLPDPDGAGTEKSSPIMSYTYDLVGNELTMTDALNNVTTYTYDDLYRLKTVTEADPDGSSNPLLSPVTTYAYDVASQLSSVTDPLSRVTSYAYDGLGRTEEITLPDPDGAGSGLSPVFSYTYDLMGNVLTTDEVIDATSKNTTTYVYDNLYRLKTETDDNSDTTSYTYDLANNLLTVTDPANSGSNVTTYDYDDLDRLTSETITIGVTDHTRSYSYDAMGNETSMTDRNGRVTDYVYDNLYRLTTEKWLDGSQQVIQQYDFTYDAASQLLTAGDTSDNYDYTYDLLGRVTDEVQAFAGLTPDMTLTRDYDPMSNLIEIQAAIGLTNDFQTDYTYDNLYRIDSIQQSDQAGNAVAEKRVDYAWDVASQISTIERYADLLQTDHVATSTFVFDKVSRLTDLTHARGATTFADYDWQYDQASRITDFDFSAITDSIGTTTGAQSSDYTYDDRGQLTAADHDYQTDEDYSYDENGNRTTGIDSDIYTNATFTTGDHNRLTSDGTYDYEYDNEGNRTRRTHIANDTVTVYDWDYRNRLITVTEYGSTSDANAETNSTKQVDHTYDVFNRWIAREVDPDGDGGSAAIESTYFVYDGAQIVMQFDGSAAGDLTNRYLWGPGTDQLLADEQVANVSTASDVYWALADNLGSVRQLALYDDVGDTTTIEKYVEYDSFGNVTLVVGSVAQLFGYTGRAFDDSTGLQNNLNRWYDATTGRWMSEDPIGFNAGDPNLYRYVGNFATGAVDSDGLEGKSRSKQFAKDVLDQILDSDERMAGWMDEVSEEMKEWELPEGSKDTGAYGKEFEKRFLKKVNAYNDGWFGSGRYEMGTLIQHKGKGCGIVRQVSGAKSGTKISLAVDVVYVPDGQELKVGKKIDARRVAAYEIKNSASGRPDKAQLKKYRKIFGPNRTGLMVGKYRMQATGKIIDNTRYTKKVKALAIVGCTGAGIYSMIEFDYEGDLFEQMTYKYELAVQEGTAGAKTEAVSAMFEYIEAGTGGFGDDLLNFSKLLALMEAIKD